MRGIHRRGPNSLGQAVGRATEGHALAVVEKMLSNARGFTVEDVGGSPNVNIVTHVPGVSSPKKQPSC